MRPSLPALCTLALAAALGAAPAFAAAPGPRRPPSAAEEAPMPGISQAECDKRFAEFDANRDGTLTYQEFANGRFGQLRFAMAPSEREVKGFIAQYTASARKADVNRDGRLTRREHLATCADGP